jgi:hypothetical protein
VQFFDREQIVEVLYECGGTLLSYFFLSKMDSSDLLVDPNSFLLGNSGRMMCSLSLVTSFSNY